MQKYFLLFLASVIFMITGPAKLFANVKLPAIFSDKMVLQQNTKVAVWGWADAGEEITITASWAAKNSIKTKADASGNFKLMMPTPKAGGPFMVTIKGNITIELNDVLVGEVWVCSGQSNMVFSLKSSDHGKEEIAKADFPTIRYFSVKRQYGPDEFKDAPSSVWEKTSPATAPGFSAVAYYFAKKIQEQLHVPVGIVYAAWGGTPAEAWVPSTALKSDTVLYRYINRWKDMYVTVGKDSADYHIALSNWEAAKKMNGSIKLKKPDEPATLVWFNRPWRQPSVLFNGMISPVIPYGIKGILWYQGESNVNFANEYFQLLSSMINSWRQKWDTQKNLSFYFAQLAPFGYSNMDAAARLREAQYQVTQQLPNTGMAVTMDVGEMKDQHFTHKKEVGERLAIIALAKDYNNKKIIFKGPEVKDAFVKNEKVMIEFESTAAALTVSGDTLKGFEIGYILPGTDSIVFVPAVAKIAGNKVIVWNEKVTYPVEVRYAWLLAGEANLFNKEGLPAFPFRKKVKKY